ncbi:MAG: hypothetical protein N3B10_09575 [Armatimonadetes bacterium]|nr:hypothetical protein [Armatimonadota bacterium]MCX7968718.1 hypothetical protein [Armatimonadota bacterium]MDW8144003.1 hypothetical protein [Armatimonadota bacterium]
MRLSPIVSDGDQFGRVGLETDEHRLGIKLAGNFRKRQKVNAFAELNGADFADEGKTLPIDGQFNLTAIMADWRRLLSEG